MTAPSSPRTHLHVVLPRLVVQHANAQVAHNVVGAPAVTAHLGFARMLARRLSDVLDARQPSPDGSWPCRFESVAIRHHGAHLEGEAVYGRFEPYQVRGVHTPSDRSDRKVLLSDQPFAQTSYRCALALTVSVPERRANRVVDVLEDSSFWAELVARARFAGGVITDSAAPVVVDNQKDAVKRLERQWGWWVLDRRAWLGADAPTPKGMPHVDQLDRAIGRLHPPQEAPGPRPWTALSLVGYALAEDPVPMASRAGARAPHAYAEPLLGLVAYQRTLTTADPSEAFWAWAWPNQRVVVAQSRWTAPPIASDPSASPQSTTPAFARPLAS